MANNETAKKNVGMRLLLGGLALLAVAAVVLLVDPLGWNLLDKASGLRDEAAGAMPANVGLYAGIDLINFSEETLTEFSQPFVTALAGPGVDDLAGGLERLDATLAEEFGLTLGDDVMPWLGRSVGLAVTDLAVRPDGTLDRVSWLLVAGSQDRRAADEFLTRLGRELTRRGGVAASEGDYRGRTIASFGPDGPAFPGGLAYTRSAGQVILGSDETAVKAAIDAQEGESLADGEMFQRLTASLPEERGLTLYADQARLPELSRLAAGGAPLSIGPLDLTGITLPAGAIGVSIIAQGLRLDTAVTVDADTGHPTDNGDMADRLPPETMVFVTGDSLAGGWQALKALLARGGNLTDFEESMLLLRREFGYDPDQMLLPVLDGEWALALLPAEEGLVSELTGQPLGVAFLASGDDEATLTSAVDELSRSLAEQRLPLATVELGEATATTIDLTSLIGAPLPLYGIDEGVLFLGTDAHTLAQVLAAQNLAGEGVLADDMAYRAAEALLPEDYRILTYVDVARLVAQLSGSTVDPAARLIEPVQWIVAANGPAVDGVRHGVVFVTAD